MNGSLAARLEEQKFMAAFNGLFERFSAQQMITFMNDSLAARLEKSKVMEAFNGLFEKQNFDQMVIIKSASLAARLEEQKIMAACNGLFERLSAERMITLMNDSLAARLEKSKVMEAFTRLFEKYSAEQIVMMCTCIILKGSSDSEVEHSSLLKSLRFELNLSALVHTLVKEIIRVIFSMFVAFSKSPSGCSELAENQDQKFRDLKLVI